MTELESQYTKLKCVVEDADFADKVKSAFISAGLSFIEITEYIELGRSIYIIDGLYPVKWTESGAQERVKSALGMEHFINPNGVIVGDPVLDVRCPSCETVQPGLRMRHGIILTMTNVVVRVYECVKCGKTVHHGQRGK